MRMKASSHVSVFTAASRSLGLELAAVVSALAFVVVRPFEMVRPRHVLCCGLSLVK